MVLLSALVALMQLSDSYLRYLAFNAQISKTESRHFFYRSCILSAFLILVYCLIFDTFGATAATYKAILMILWLPHFVILMWTIRRPKAQHIFVLGMVAIWSILQNNWAALIDVAFFEKLSPEEILLRHSAMYLTLFILMLPLEKKIFTQILPETQLFESRPLGLYIAILPLVMMTGHLFLWADAELFHSWTERFSRLYLLVAFILIHKYVSLGSKLFYDNQKTFNNVRLLEEQVASLNYHSNLIQDSARQMQNLRENLQQNYLQLYQMILNDEVDDAQNFIKQQAEKLQATKIISFCAAPLINASLSIYAEQAKHYDIKFSHEINLLELNPADEKDFAILLSNLLENAINASKIQPQGRRSISVIINTTTEKSVLEISNHFEGDLKIGTDGLPENHGVGMTTLKNFISKYKVHVEFLHIEDYVHVMLYKEA